MLHSIKTNDVRGLMDTEIQNISMIAFGSTVHSNATTPVLSLNEHDIASMLIVLFIKKFSLNSSRYDDIVFRYWCHLGIQSGNEFKAPRHMTQAIAAIHYCIRLLVLYLCLGTDDNAQYVFTFSLIAFN